MTSCNGEFLAGKSYHPPLSSAFNVVEVTPTSVPIPDVGRELNIPAARVLPKTMYGARMARQDLLRAVCALARMPTRWDGQCDRRILRLISYINSTLGIG